MTQVQTFDVVILGGGAAGLMAAYHASARGLRTLLIEHTQKLGEKIRISGGGRCNFTNLGVTPKQYLSHNPHFCRSALAQYTQHDFIALISSFNIAYHEKTLGQLFCDGSATQIIQMFRTLCDAHKAHIMIDCTVTSVTKGDHFTLCTSKGVLTSHHVIVATGGLSIPKIGASDFAYRLAKHFEIPVIPTLPALVPLKSTAIRAPFFKALSGTSFKGRVHFKNTAFDEGILLTHRGLSGPAILQISSYLPDFRNQNITLNCVPGVDLYMLLMAEKNTRQHAPSLLKKHLSNRFVDAVMEELIAQQPLIDRPLAELKKQHVRTIANAFQKFNVCVEDSEGYQKAEVTKGGIDTNALSSQTMMCKHVPGLFFVGEAVDVTGWLGGYNFQWAWSSAYVAAQSITKCT